MFTEKPQIRALVNKSVKKYLKTLYNFNFSKNLKRQKMLTSARCSNTSGWSGSRLITLLSSNRASSAFFISWKGEKKEKNKESKQLCILRIIYFEEWRTIRLAKFLKVYQFKLKALHTFAKNIKMQYSTNSWKNLNHLSAINKKNKLCLYTSSLCCTFNNLWI